MRLVVIGVLATLGLSAAVFLYARVQWHTGIDMSLASEHSVTDPTPGSLGLSVYPDGGEVRIDGKLVGLAAAGRSIEIRADKGLHELLVQRGGFHDHRSLIRFETGEHRHAAVHLLPHRHHAPQDERTARLRRADVVRGSLEEGDLTASKVLLRLGSEIESRTTDGLADDVELVGLEIGRSARLRVLSTYRIAYCRIFDDRGVVVAMPPENLSWSYTMTFNPEEGRRYFAVIEHDKVEKFSIMGLIRYALHLRQR